MGEIDRQLDEAIERELAEYGELLPLWIKYPDLPDGSIGWRMGSGEFYAMTFSRWWARVPHEERLSYFQRYLPIPLEWAWYVASCLFGDDAVERLIELGLIDQEEWRSWCAR